MPGQDGPLLTESVLTVRADIHSSFNASFTKCFLHCWGVKLEGRSSSSLSEGHLHHFSSKITDGTSKQIARCTGLPCKCPGADGGSGPFLGGEEWWAGQGEGRELLVVKSHLLRP